MQKIKFRAWHRKKGMLRCFSLHSSGMIAYVSDNWLGEKESPILMQFTGVKDDLGKEIYVADVVEIDHLFLATENCVAKFEGGIFYLESEVASNNMIFIHQLRANKDFKMKVIGNIYENPELLNC